MTWGEFVASEYNTINELGDKSFRDVGTIQYGMVYNEKTPDGMDYWTEYTDVHKNYIGVNTIVFSDEHIREDINYIIL